jgi:hypothetical protein
MAVTFVRATTSSATTFSHIVDSYSDRILIVAINNWYAAVSAVTYAGYPMTKAFDRASAGRIYLSYWYLVGPPIGTANVVITGSGTFQAVAALTYSGVDQVTPFGVSAGADDADGTPTTVNVTSEAGQLVLDIVGHCHTSGGANFTVGAGQTERAQIESPGGGTTYPRVACSEEAGAASVTMSWTIGTATATSITGIPLRMSSDPPKRIVAYTDDLASDDRRLLDANGNRLQPWEIRADAWVRYAGWAPPSSVVYDSLVDDPTCGYIEDVSWDSDSDVAATTTSRMDLGEIIISRASAQSNG